MFKRRWPWLGVLVSDDGFKISFGRPEVYYQDERGTFALGYEDGFLFPHPFQVKGNAIVMSQSEVDQMVDRVVRGIQYEGLSVEVLAK